MEQKQGLIHIYCGDGKGKTTAAVGLCVRAAGRGMRVCMVQFLKSTETGELNILTKIPNLQIIRSDETLGFTFRMNEEERCYAASVQQKLLDQAKSVVQSQTCDMIILDEIMAAVNSGMIDPVQVIKFVKEKPKQLEMVLTGRNPPQEFLELADYVSDIKKIKHPYDQGIAARNGIER